MKTNFLHKLWTAMHPHEKRKLKHVGKLSITSEALYHVSELAGMHMGTTIAAVGLLGVLVIHLWSGEVG